MHIMPKVKAAGYYTHHCSFFISNLAQTLHMKLPRPYPRQRNESYNTFLVHLCSQAYLKNILGQLVSSELSLQSGAPLHTLEASIHLAVWASIQRLPPPSQMTESKKKTTFYDTIVQKILHCNKSKISYAFLPKVMCRKHYITCI